MPRISDRQEAFSFDPRAPLPAWGRAVRPDPLRILRPYQREAVEAICKAERSCLLVMATGCGKTEVFIALCKKLGGRTLILAERKGLVHQTAKRARERLGEEVEVEQGEHLSQGKTRVIVASKDSLHPDRLERLVRKGWEPDIIIVDEAHHSVSDSYIRIFDRFPGARRVGVTATPDRRDEIALGEVFSDVAYVYEIDDAIRDGWLVRVRVRRRIVEDMKLDALDKSGGDFVQQQLDDLVRQEAVLHQIAKDTLDFGEGRRGIVFVPGIESARLLAEVFNYYQPGSAASVDQSTPDADRAALYARHRRGELRYLCNVNILTEGYDDPGVDLVVNAAPTTSRARIAQRVGRGTRPLPGLVDRHHYDRDARIAAIAGSAKRDLLVIDFVGQLKNGTLCGPEDVLGGKSREEVIRRARELAEEKEGGDVADLLAQAEAELARKEEIKRRNELRKKARIVVQVKGKVVEFDPFEFYRISDVESKWGGSQRYGWKPPTEKMLAAIRNRGIEPGEGMSWKEAKVLLDGIMGKPTVKMIRSLDRDGFDAREWSFEYAKEVLDKKAKRQWRPFSDAEKRAIAERAKFGREAGEDG